MSTLSGRTMERNTHLCYGCGARLETGEVRRDTHWAGALTLTKVQVATLLLAAAEYDDLSAACYHCHHKPHPSAPGDCGVTDCYCANYVPSADSSAESFIDWVKVDALPGLYSRETQRERRDEIRKAEKAERDRLRREVA